MKPERRRSSTRLNATIRWNNLSFRFVGKIRHRLYKLVTLFLIILTNLSFSFSFLASTSLFLSISIFSSYSFASWIPFLASSTILLILVSTRRFILRPPSYTPFSSVVASPFRVISSFFGGVSEFFGVSLLCGFSSSFSDSPFCVVSLTLVLFSNCLLSLYSFVSSL